MNFDQMIEHGEMLPDKVPATPVTGALSGTTAGNLRAAIGYLDRTIGKGDRPGMDAMRHEGHMMEVE